MHDFLPLLHPIPLSGRNARLLKKKITSEEKKLPYCSENTQMVHYVGAATLSPLTSPNKTNLQSVLNSDRVHFLTDECVH